MKRLENKSVIITAAGQGIGRETAIRFLNEGANVIATDINRSRKLEELSKQYPKIKIHTLDSTNAEDVKKFCNNISKIDILFNCIDFVRPITAALVAPYTNRSFTPLILDTTDAIFIITPEF